MWDWDREQRPPPAVLPGHGVLPGVAVLLGLLGAAAGFYLRDDGRAASPRPAGSASPAPLRPVEPVTTDLAVGESLLLSSGRGPARVTVTGFELGGGKCTPQSRGEVVVQVAVSGTAPVLPSAFTLTDANGRQVRGADFCSSPVSPVRIGFDAASVRLLSYTPYGGAALGSWRLG